MVIQKLYFAVQFALALALCLLVEVQLHVLVVLRVDGVAALEDVSRPLGHHDHAIEICTLKIKILLRLRCSAVAAEILISDLLILMHAWIELLIAMLQAGASRCLLLRPNRRRQGQLVIVRPFLRLIDLGVHRTMAAMVVVIFFVFIMVIRRHSLFIRRRAAVL